MSPRPNPPMSPRRRLAALALALVALTGAGAVVAQDFPTRPIKLVIPYTAGGTADTLGRMAPPSWPRARATATRCCWALAPRTPHHRP